MSANGNAIRNMGCQRSRASVNAPSQQRANGREQLQPSEAVTGEALPQSSTGQLRVAMGSLTAPLCLFSVGSGPNCGICRPNVGAAATSQPRILPYVGRETMWRHCERLGRSPWRVDASECGIFDVVSNPAGHGAENIAEDARG